MTEKHSIAQQRRSFLKGVAAAGGAAALTLASRDAVSATSGKSSKADKDTASKGYRKTSHIRDFYVSARI